MFDFTPYAVVDTETNGLDRTACIPWEIAIWRWSPTLDEWSSWLIQISDYDPAWMTPEAAEVNGFHQRWGKENFPTLNFSQVAASRMISNILRGAVLIGSNPGFDADMLTNLGCAPTWSHRMRDVPTLVMGLEGADYGGLQNTAVRLGWDLDDPKYAPHTAMGDATLTKDIFAAVMETDRGYRAA